MTTDHLRCITTKPVRRRGWSVITGWKHDVEKDTSDRVSVRIDCSLLDICFLSLPLTAIRWMIWIHLDGAADER